MREELFNAFWLCKECPYSKWIGDILRAFGGQEVELDFGQKQVLVAIQYDSQGMDERIEKKKERHRALVQKYRNKPSGESQESHESQESQKSQVSVTSHTSIHPSSRECQFVM